MFQGRTVSFWRRSRSPWKVRVDRCTFLLRMVNLTWPMAKLFQLFGITYLVGKISRSNFYFRVHWLSEKFSEATCSTSRRSQRFIHFSNSPTAPLQGAQMPQLASWLKLARSPGRCSWTRMEDVFRSENGDIPASYVSLPVGKPRIIR